MRAGLAVAALLVIGWAEPSLASRPERSGCATSPAPLPHHWLPPEDPGDAGVAAPDELAAGAAEDDQRLEAVLQPAPAPAVEEPPPQAPRPRAILETLLWLFGLFALAYLGAHAKVLAWEERLGLTQVITAGLPFVVLGIVARTFGGAMFDDQGLRDLAPLLRFGLGWLGFAAGMRWRMPENVELDRGVFRDVALLTGAPFLLLLGAGALLFLDGPMPDLFAPSAEPFLRDALTLGTAAAISATVVFPSPSPRLVATLRLAELLAVALLGASAVLFRPLGPDVSWQLPAAGWAVITLGLFTAMGLLAAAVLSPLKTRNELLVAVPGVVGFAAGLAGHLQLSAVVVCYFAGVLLARMPGLSQASVGALFRDLERPVYLALLFIAGALVRLDSWRGWLLVVLFAVLRAAGKWGAASWSERKTRGAPGTSWAEASLPVGSLAIAVVISARLLHRGGAISEIATAVIFGTLLTELLIQLRRRAFRVGT